MPFAKTCFLKTVCCAVALFLAQTLAFAQSAGKIPREVIDQAAAQGTVMVLVGLDVPWQMESRLNADEVRVQREIIASIQRDLLTDLQGRSYKVIRRYDQIPGLALEVGPDALAELARSPNVTNVLLDRPAPETDADTAPSAEKVPWQLFKRAASNGTVLVLAGLRTPWQREEQLSEPLISPTTQCDFDRPGLSLGRAKRHAIQSHAPLPQYSRHRAARQFGGAAAIGKITGRDQRRSRSSRQRCALKFTLQLT